MGVTLAFVCEAIERRWIRPEEIGVTFGWGDWRGMLRPVEMTATCEGFGDRLAEGSWRLARLPTGGVADRVRGEAGRAARTRTLGARALGPVHRVRHRHPRGQPSRHPPHAPVRAGLRRKSADGKPEFGIRSQHFTAVGDSLVVCRFTSERGLSLYVEEPYSAWCRPSPGGT